MRIDVLPLCGENCITRDDGIQLHDRLHAGLQTGDVVECNFAGVSVFASPFFNAAVGALLKDFSADDLNKRLRFLNLSSVGRDVLRRVVENAREYFSNEATRRAVDENIKRLSDEDDAE